MRIISGILKGRNIKLPSSINIRPTTDRVREALFNIIDVQSKNFTDLFSGTGAVALEAISRGAQNVCSVELNKQHCRFIEQNKKLLKVNLKIINTDAASFIRHIDASNIPDFLFMDPPYKYSLKENIFPVLNKSKELLSYCMIIIEHEANNKEIENISGNLNLLETRNYGKSALSFLKMG